MLLPMRKNHFVNNEFENLRLGDARLDKRVSIVGEMINDSTALSFPDSSNGDRSKLKAFYRFFRNRKILCLLMEL